MEKASGITDVPGRSPKTGRIAAGTVRSSRRIRGTVSARGKRWSRQRAAIARALAIEPQLLICDEATSALDVTVQKQIMELLDRMRKEKNLTILFICHNLALVQSFCDQILVMKQGKIVEEGKPEEVIRHPQHAYTKQLVESVL